MQEINIDRWRDFRVGDLFEIKPTKAYKCTNAELLNGGKNPVVVNSSYNNGIGGYSTFPATEKGNMVTFSDTVDANTIFYQAVDFIGYPHVQGLYPKGEYANCWNDKSLKFYVAVFRKAALTKGFDYGNKFRRDIAVKLIVKLPVDEFNQPDWSYMERYILKVEQKANSNILSLLYSIVDHSQKKIDISSWKRFRIGLLFPCIFKPKVYHAYEVEPSEEGIPYIVRSKFNNGMKCRVRKKNLQTSPAGVISFGAENASFFYQSEEWCSGRDIYYIDTRNYSPYTCMFIITCLEKIAARYSYNYGLFPELLNAEHIFLPVTAENEPDWGYIENYMKTIEKKTKKVFTGLKLNSLNN